MLINIWYVYTRLFLSFLEKKFYQVQARVDMIRFRVVVGRLEVNHEMG